MKIQNNIIQCHTLGVAGLNDEERSAIEKLKIINPSWVYLFYDLEMMRGFINDNYPSRYLSAFDKINNDYGAAKSDYFRYLAIYKLGGVYMDNKAFVNKPLSDIIQHDDEMVVFSVWSSFNETIKIKEL